MQKKTAETSLPIHPLLAERWSPRAIDSSKPLSPEIITKILEAARWAPSCANQQPWRFMVFTAAQPEALESARSCLAGGNYWAKRAPLLIIGVARQTWEHNGTPNPYAEHDLGLATQNLLLEASDLGLAAHPMAGFDSKMATELFQIPEGFKAMTAIAIGYPGLTETLGEKHQQAEQAPRTRKPLDSDNIGNNPGATTPEQLTRVLVAVRDWSNVVTRAALQVQAALFQRPGTTCAMRWADVDLEAARWVVPVEKRTKLHKSLKGAAHVVPLPRQVVALLRELHALTGHSEWVFLSTANTGGPITNDTLNNALRSMGLGKLQTAHGFRATARTLAPKMLGDVAQAQYVEAHLAHAIGMQTIDGRMVRDVLGSAYNRATWLDERAPMLQAWADYLDGLLTQAALPAAVPLKLAA